jgi:hypothetical protein
MVGAGRTLKPLAVCGMKGGFSSSLMEFLSSTLLSLLYSTSEPGVLAGHMGPQVHVASVSFDWLTPGLKKCLSDLILILPGFLSYSVHHLKVSGSSWGSASACLPSLLSYRSP